MCTSPSPAATLSFDRFTVERGSKSPYDLGFQSVTGYCVTAAKTTTGATAKVDSSNSTASCGGSHR
jgi:hypothetical protein